MTTRVLKPIHQNTRKPRRIVLASLLGHSISRLCCLALLSATTAASPATCGAIKAEAERWVTGRVDALVIAARGAYRSDRGIRAYDRVLDGITGTIRDCKLKDDRRFLDRYRVFVDYVETAALERDPEHELGFLVSDQQYFAETFPFVQIPPFLLDQEFLRAVSRSETLPRAKSYLQQLNRTREPAAQMIFFSYKSQHLGTPDNDDSFRRLLVVVPGNPAQGEPEKWVQFGVTDPGARVRVRNVSVVSAVPQGNGIFNAYFKDYYRSYRPDGFIDLKGRWELGEGDDNCTQCHKSGVLPIFPAPGSVRENERAALLKANERFRSYGSPRFGRYLDSEKLGPGLGAASLADRQQRFGRDFPERPAGRAMVCSSCHNAQRLGALNWPMDRILISSFVNGGQMPLGHQLPLTQRRSLYAGLVQEYFATEKNNPGILKSWLLSEKR
jgi:hypothetical protein